MSAIEHGKTIVKQLKDAGYEAFFVGGAVRDDVLGIVSDDVDITTSARPQTVESLFEHTVLTGKAFGTVTVLHANHAFEVTTYRRETHYDNHRHPSYIAFADTVEEDVSRRDFTMNQLLMDENGEITDIYGGLEDIESGIIETIGNAHERFREDALRMLRALRFMATLDFTLSDEVEQAIKANHTTLKHISLERIQVELVKLFDAQYKPPALKAMQRTGLHETLGLEQTVNHLANQTLPYTALDAFTLAYDYGELAQSTFKLSNKFFKQIEAIHAAHARVKREGFAPKGVFDYGLKTMLHVNVLRQFEGHASKKDTIERIHNTLKLRDKKALAINGKTIKAMSPAKKEHIALTLDTLIEQVLNGEVDNEPTALKASAQIILSKMKSE